MPVVGQVVEFLVSGAHQRVREGEPLVVAMELRSMAGKVYIHWRAANVTTAQTVMQKARKCLNELKAALGTEIPNSTYWLLEDLHDAIGDLEILMEGMESRIAEWVDTHG